MSELHEISQRAQELLAKVIEVASKPVKETMERIREEMRKDFRKWSDTVDDKIDSIEEIDELIKRENREVLSEIKTGKEEAMAKIHIISNSLDEVKGILGKALEDQKEIRSILSKNREEVLKKVVLAQRSTENRVEDLKSSFEHFRAEQEKNAEKISSEHAALKDLIQQVLDQATQIRKLLWIILGLNLTVLIVAVITMVIALR